MDLEQVKLDMTAHSKAGPTRSTLNPPAGFHTATTTTIMRPPSPPPPLLRIGETWDILGPFQIGTREAEWGADPLSHPRYGSFQALSPSDATFPSSLCPSGLASWSTADASCHSPESVSVPISFPEIDWNGVKESYGWAGLQFQAWARGTIEVVGTENKRVVIYVAGAASEFWVDSQKQFFGGDFYGFRRAPVVITLGPGLHSIDVRVSHDIRAFGGAVPPEVEFGVDVQEACPEGLVVEIEKALVSDVVDGKLVGQWASVPVRNECVNWIEILGVEGGDVSVAPSS